MGEKTVDARSGWDVLPAGTAPDGRPAEVKVLFVHRPDYFDRPHLYGDATGDYPDNAERFLFFSRAVLELCRLMALRPHCLHANDWQTGIACTMLREQYRGSPGFETTGCVFTVHNLAFQGSFPNWDMHLTGLDWRLFNYTQLEHHGRLNLLKAGITSADKVTTVSPTYAQEICTPTGGCSLEGALAARGDDLSGVLNGIDPEDWNPAADPHLPANYDRRDRRRRQGEVRRGPAGGTAPRPARCGVCAKRRSAVRDGQPADGSKGFRPDRRLHRRAAGHRGAVRLPGQRRPAVRGVRAAPRQQARRPGGGGDRLRQRPGPPHRGRRRRLPHAESL